MARLFQSGFELNSAAAGVEFSNASGSPTISSTTYRSGSYAGRISSLSSGTAKYFGHTMVQTTIKTMFARFYFRVATLPSAENRIFLINDAVALTTPVVYLTLDNSGVLKLYDEDGQITGTSTLSTGTWYRIEVKVDISAASGSHIVEAKVDGASAFASASDRAIGQTNLLYPVFGGNLNSEAQTTGDWFFDDIAINNEKSIFGQSYTAYGNAGGSAANDLYGIKWIAPESGTVDSITFYGNGNSATRNFKAVLLNSSKQIVTNGVGNATAATTTTGYWTSSFSTPPSVTAGTTYYLGIVVEANVFFYYRNLTVNTEAFIKSNSYSSPVDVTGETASATHFLFYASYSPTGGGTPINTSYPGEGAVVVALPNGNGDNNATTGNYSMINEIPPSDTASSGSTMAELDTNPKNIDVTVSSPTTMGINSGSVVNAVSIIARMREDTAGTTNYFMRIKSASSGSLYLTPAVDCGDATTVRSNPSATTSFVNQMVSNTDPTTGLRWTVAGTNSLTNMQIGVGTTDGSPDTWVLGLYAMIDFVQNTSPTTALNTPADSATGVSVTPTLNFTGTDADGDTLEYNAQVDTVNTFDSQVSTFTTPLANTSAAGTTDLVTTSGIDTTGANLIILGVSYNTGTTPTITDSKGNTWTGLTAQAQASNGASRIYYCYNPTVGSGHTFSNSTSGGFSTITVQAWADALSAPFDQENGAKTAGASTLATGSITPGVDNEVIISHFMFSAAGTASVNSSMTISNQQNFGAANNYGGALAYKVQTTATAINPTWTSGGGSTGLAATIASFKVNESPLVNALSASDAGFTAGHPFASGAAKDYTVQSALANSTEHFWRVRAIDPTGTNTYGAWATTRSFTTTAGGGTAVKDMLGGFIPFAR